MNKAPSYPVPAILCIQQLFSLLLLKCEDSGHFILTLASAKKFAYRYKMNITAQDTSVGKVWTAALSIMVYTRTGM